MVLVGLAVLGVGMRIFKGIDRSSENGLNGNLLGGSLIYVSVTAYLGIYGDCRKEIV